jgi:hypothetical protein
MEAAAVTLPEDLIREILVRLDDAAALFRCATTCKTWCILVIDRSFLRRRWPPEDEPADPPSTFNIDWPSFFMSRLNKMTARPEDAYANGRSSAV